MSDSSTRLEELLQEVMVALNQEFLELAKRDTRLDALLCAGNDSSVFNDEAMLDQLLREVSEKANSLYGCRLEYSWYRQQDLATQDPSTREVLLTTPRQIAASQTLKGSVTLPRDGVWVSVHVQTELPVVVEYHGISMSIEALERSAMGFRLPFSLEGTFPMEVYPAEELSAVEQEGKFLDFTILKRLPSPTLTGVQMSDDQGTLYTLEAAPLVKGPQGSRSRWKMESALIFSGTPPLHIGVLHLVIQSVLILPQHVFVTTALPAHLIKGPWEFLLTLGN